MLRGVDVLVFDHHESKGEQPACLALVNPKLGADFHYLCSVGIVFKACHALLKMRPAADIDLREYLDIVARVRAALRGDSSSGRANTMFCALGSADISGAAE